MRMKAAMLFGASVLALVSPGVAAAQAGPQAAAAPGPGTAKAGQPDESQDIIVTAQKRAENITRVPISITVISDRQLQSTDSKNLVQLQGIVPGVTVEGDRSYGGANIAIRGTSGATTPLQDDPVAIYVDGVYTPPNLFGTNALSDIASLEIVRGPQGTLQGRNATAGAILVRTADPGAAFGGYVRAQIADPLQYRVEAAITGPLSEGLRARLSVDYLYDRGWVRNAFNGSRLGGQKSINVRGTLLWNSGNFRARLVGAYFHVDAKEALARWAQTNINPTGQAVTVPTPGVPLTGAQQRALEDGNFNLDFPTFYKTDGANAALEMSYDFGGVELVSVSGISHYSTPGQTDSAGIAVAPRYGYNIGRLAGTFVSEELRLQSDGTGPFKWLIGGYVSDSDSDFQFNIYNLMFTSPANIVSRFTATQDNLSLAAFADATYNLTPELAVTGGVRYTSESKDFHNTFGVQSVTTGAYTVGPLPFNPAKKTWNDTSYRAKLSYSPTRDSLLYVSYSRGFKSGGFNAFTAGSSVPFNPEVLKSLELGAKADLLDRRIHLAASVYHNKYSNLQVTSGVPTGGVMINNAAAATINGFEIEGLARITPHFTVEGNVAYTDGSYDSFRNAPNILGVQVDASGANLPRTPRWQYFAQATYDFPLSASWKIETQVNWRWRDRVYYTATNQTATNLQSRPGGELGGRLRLTNTDSDFSVSLFGVNLTNERRINSLALAFAYPSVAFNRPRTIGVQLEKKF